MSIPTSVAARFAAGVALPFRALAYLATRRAVWPHALLPVLLTLAGLAIGLVAAVPASGSLLALLWDRPEGLLAAAWWLTRAALFLVLVYVAAIALPATVSAPFSDRLSTRVETLEIGESAGGGVARAAAETWAGVAHAFVRLAWLLGGHALLLPALLVPFAYPVLAFLWTARWTAVEYLDLPMSRNLHRLAEVRAALRAVRPMGAGFGSVLAGLFLVPFANLVVVPVGAVAGTLLYCDLVRAGHLTRTARSPSLSAPEPDRPEPRRRSGPSVLLGLLIGVSILVVPSVAVFQYLAKSHVVYAESLGRLEASEAVQRAVGAPLRPSLWTYARVVRGSGSWRYSVEGPNGRADVVVSARRRADGWRLEYVLVKPEGAKRSFSLEPRERGEAR